MRFGQNAKRACHAEVSSLGSSASVPIINQQAIRLKDQSKGNGCNLTRVKGGRAIFLSPITPLLWRYRNLIAEIGAVAV